MAPKATPGRIPAVGAVVMRPDGQVLLVRRGRPPGKGHWSLPGGKIERDETPADAVVREVIEETGIRVAVVELLGVLPLDGDGYSYAVHEFLCVPDDGDRLPRAGDDAEDARWVTPEEAAGLGVSREVALLIGAPLPAPRADA